MPDEPEQAPAPLWPMYRAMVGTGMACALLIAAVYGWTKPVIAAKRSAALAAAVYAVLPGAERKQALAGQGGEIYAGFDADGALVGYAIPAEGMGYQDTIKLLYGLEAEQQRIIGFKVLQSRETPGLGDRIETDPAFLANFTALDVSVDESGALRNPVVAVKAGRKREAWQVDGISGATVSSVAIADILGASAAHWVPALSGQEMPE